MVLDSANSNDTVMEALGGVFGRGPGERRLRCRCLGRSIDLAVR
jgi:hypothetical protein